MTVEFGCWETHLPEPLGTGEGGAPQAANQAIDLVEQWLSGELRTAVYTDATKKWCGSKLIEEGDLEAQLREGTQWLRDFCPRIVEVRSPRKEDWQTVIINSSWLVPPPLRPDRLP